jgi:hypothetical protein
MVDEHNKCTENSDIIIVVLVNMSWANGIIPRTMVQESAKIRQMHWTQLSIGMNLGGTKARRLVKGLESFLSLIMDSFLRTCNFGMLGVKLGLDHSTIMAILAFVSFLWAISLCVLETRHHLLIKLRRRTRHGA